MHSIKWKWVGAAALALVLAACGGGSSTPSAEALCASAGTQPKIFNGTNCANPNQSPVVQIAMQINGETFTCSGVMLTANKVLSAGHCFPSGTQRVAVVVEGANGAAQFVDAQSWVVHPAYSERFDAIYNDVAVVTLGAAVPNPTMPLLVSSPSQKGNKVFLAGWGLPSLDLAVGFAKLTNVTENHLEVQFEGTLGNSCQGDSGGPVYRVLGDNRGVVGLTSTGTSAICGATDQSLFTNTQAPAVLGFIRSQAPGAAEI